MSNSGLRGHPTEFDEEVLDWVLCGTRESTQTAWFTTPCIKCGKVSTEEGHDACLGTLIGLRNACCGHGIAEHAYVQFWDGTSIHGKDAIIIQNILKKYSNENAESVYFKEEDEN